MIVNLAPAIVGANPYLDRVVYTTTSVDDGYTIEDPTETQGNCYTDASVSPTTQTFGATDYQYDWGSGPRCRTTATRLARRSRCTTTDAAPTLLQGWS